MGAQHLQGCREQAQAAAGAARDKVQINFVIAAIVLLGRGRGGLLTVHDQDGKYMPPREHMPAPRRSSYVKIVFC